MIAPDEKLTEARIKDVLARFRGYISRHSIALVTVARQIGVGNSTMSDLLRGKYRGARDKYIRRINNWMELDARRRSIFQNTECVETSVAREIMQVATIVAETLKIGVVFGPARIGKSFCLESLAGSDRLGNPILFRADDSCRRSMPVGRMICDALGISQNGPFDAMTRRIVNALHGTKRMLMFDEAERFSFRALEYVRDIHDLTGCGILFCGKPAIYEKLGFRDMGEYKEVCDQLAGRVVIRRDLTERTRRHKNPEPLFSKDDIRKLINTSNLELKVENDAIDWLQSRASRIGLGGIGKVTAYLYLASRYCIASGIDSITAEILEAVEQTTLGFEDVGRVHDIVEDSSGARIRRLA